MSSSSTGLFTGPVMLSPPPAAADQADTEPEDDDDDDHHHDDDDDGEERRPPPIRRLWVMWMTATLAQCILFLMSLSALLQAFTLRHHQQLQYQQLAWLPSPPAHIHTGLLHVQHHYDDVEEEEDEGASFQRHLHTRTEPPATETWAVLVLLAAMLLAQVLANGLLLLPTLFLMISPLRSSSWFSSSSGTSRDPSPTPRRRRRRTTSSCISSALNQTARWTCQAQAVSTTIVGLTCIMTSLLLLNLSSSHPTSITNTRPMASLLLRIRNNLIQVDEAAFFVLQQPLILLWLGTLVVILSGLGLMATFWPFPVRTTTRPRSPPRPVQEGGLVNDHPHPHSSTVPASFQDLTQPLLLDPETTAEGTAPKSDQDAPMNHGHHHHHHHLDVEAPRDAPDENLAPGTLPAYTSFDPPGTEPPPSTTRIRGTQRLLQLARPQVLYLYAGCIVLLIRLPFSLSIPHWVSSALSALAVGHFHQARQDVVCLLAMGTVDAILDFWCVFLFGYANQRIIKSLRLDLLATLLRQEVAFFDQTSSGELSSRLNSDCSEMAGDLTWFFRFSIESVVRITGITAYMLIRSPILASTALSIVPVVAVINKIYGNWLRQNAAAVQDALAEANAVAQEALANIRTVIAFGAESEESQRYRSKIERQYQQNIRQLYMTGIYYMAVSTFLINTVVQGILLYVGSRLIQTDRLTANVLLAFMLYQGQLQNETLNLFQSYSSLIKSSGAGDHVFGLLDRLPPPPATGNDQVLLVGPRANPSEGPDGGEAAPDGGTDPNGSDLNHHREDEDLTTPLLKEDLLQRDSKDACVEYDASSSSSSTPHIEFRSVLFYYPSRPQNTVLRDMNLSIRQGSTVAIVGISGGGKSTIINLIQRLYDPVQGQILIHGRDLRDLPLWDHRRQLAVVNQDPVLFGGTLRDNIRYGVRDATEDSIVRAAQLAHAHDFICSFPQQYDTAVGERGVQLSGGQKQRIAISRAILKKPSLLLLDEATSALDAESEQLVQDALDRLVRENPHMTVLIVAHRLRTVRHAQCILVVEHGQVVEQGTHDELVAFSSLSSSSTTSGRSQGVYRRMVERAGSTGLLPET